MNFLLVVAVMGSMLVTPVSGPAPFAPSIVVSIEGTFTGEACVYIDDLSTKGPDDLEFCEFVSIQDASTTIPIELTGTVPGKYTFTGHLHPMTGAVIELNSVAMVIEKGD